MMLVEVERGKETENLVATYKVFHSTPGREGTTLDFTVTLSQVHPLNTKFVAKVHFDNCEGDSPAEALKRLGGWCARAAEAIEKADPGFSIPVGTTSW